MTRAPRSSQDARGEVVSVRMTRAQKRRLQRIAKAKRDTVSGLLLRAAEVCEDLPPAREPEIPERIIFRWADGTETLTAAAAVERRECTVIYEMPEDMRALAE